MRGRYRLRTWLRSRLPYVLSNRISKGRKDCGNHDWYRSEDETLCCYHCVSERWINAVITIVVPIGVGLGADDWTKTEAMGKEMERVWDSLDDAYAQTIAMSGKWELVEDGDPVEVRNWREH